MKILVYDPFAGISGDMNLGAMADLGVPEEYLIEAVRSLKLDGWNIEFEKAFRKGICGTRAVVKTDVIQPGKGGSAGQHGRGCPGSAGGLNRGSHSHSHNHRKLDDIRDLLSKSSLKDAVCLRSLKMFEALAGAEGKVHGIEPEEVHFHEVGALDSIIDIVTAAAAIEYLKPDKIYSRPPELGGGVVECAHGRLPVPAPATAELLKGIPVKTGGADYEATTPTGAVILKANTDLFSECGNFRILETGYGAGSRDSSLPNLLRVFLAEAAADNGLRGQGPDEAVSETVMLECNIDDMNPEIYEHLLNTLFEAGAREAFLTPVYMKKNRPGILLTAASEPALADKIRSIIFRETTTAGLREYRVDQSMLDRKTETVSTVYGNIRFKKLYHRGKLISSKPEYEDVKKLALKHGISLIEMYNQIRK